jgi:DNA-binding NarL/FixJ family response regulator
VIRTLLVDDQALLRAGFRLILDREADIEVVGEADDGDTALELARQHAPTSCSRTRAIRRRISSAGRPLAPSTLQPPAPETAASLRGESESRAGGPDRSGEGRRRLEKREKFISRQRPTEVVALREVTAKEAQQLDLFRSFDSLRDRSYVKVLG